MKVADLSLKELWSRYDQFVKMPHFSPHERIGKWIKELGKITSWEMKPNEFSDSKYCFILRGGKL